MKQKKLKKGQVALSHFDGKSCSSSVVESPLSGIHVLLLRMNDVELTECLRSIAGQYGMKLPEHLPQLSLEEEEFSRALAYSNNAGKEMVEIFTKIDRGEAHPEETLILNEIVETLQRLQDLRADQAQWLWQKWKDDGGIPTNH